MSDSPLGRFFDEMVPYLMGETTVADLEARLGPSASGTRQLSVYAGVVPFNVSLPMAAVYAAVKHAADLVAADLWPRLVKEYFAHHPPRHWDPNRVGEAFPSFLEGRRAEDPALPAFLEELADYEWTRFLAVTSQHPGLDRTIFVRRYSHAAPVFARAVNEGKATGLPAPTAVTVIVFRSVKTRKVQVLYPSTVQLVALEQHAGEADDDMAVAAGLTSHDVAAATASLTEMGLLEEDTVR